jgi:hypothetical protein
MAKILIKANGGRPPAEMTQPHRNSTAVASTTPNNALPRPTSRLRFRNSPNLSPYVPSLQLSQLRVRRRPAPAALRSRRRIRHGLRAVDGARRVAPRRPAGPAQRLVAAPPPPSAPIVSGGRAVDGPRPRAGWPPAARPRALPDPDVELDGGDGDADGADDAEDDADDLVGREAVVAA